MATIHIELPDEQAAALRAKLAAQGLSVEGWFQKLAEVETEPLPPNAAKEAVAQILELQKHVKPDPDGWTIKDYMNYGRP